ncbi:Glutamyl-tRNA reductase [Serinicoccus hydrothermalis]|uniref:Glutamyl-tRNA reductase n=1 Tax=Serinicoccus hydrothermalis TaxID=1758689 RepID=A0A1B1NBM4_9MICO|nr:glutamyl-tRNA reductase [Serinicoccus hydrothermalis]ANS78826.1 Glutamyl-tRNA reductase [Serinicoccus hydrothermalis]
MSVLVVGLSHRTAPIDLLERAVLDADGAAGLAARLRAGDHVHEALVLSTCNRLEVVVEAGTFHGALEEIGVALGALTGLSRDQLTDHLFVHYDDRAVAHLFELACGLDSLAVGESQVLGQLREALAVAQRHGHLGPSLNPLVQQALRVGKRAHAETSIDDVSRSLVALGLDRARDVLGDLTGARTVVVGAGAMSGLAVATLVRQGVSDLVVVNRTQERAERLAAAHGVRSLPWADLASAVGSADLVITCTGAVGHVLDEGTLARARGAAGRSGAPLTLLDLALPRDVDPAVTRLRGATLWGLAELQQAAGGSAGPSLPGPGASSSSGPEEAEAVTAVRGLVATEVAAYLTERHAARLGPTLAALRTSAGRVVDAEMTRLDQRLPHLPDDERAEVRHTVQRVVDKLLHTPTTRVKQLQAGYDEVPADYAHALRELFDLDSREVAVVSSPPLGVVEKATERRKGGRS